MIKLLGLLVLCYLFFVLYRALITHGDLFEFANVVKEDLKALQELLEGEEDDDGRR